MKAFRNALVYVEGEGLKRCDLVFDRKIEAIGGEIGGAEVIELSENAVVLPGFIDEHIHGAGGADAMDGTREALKTVAETVAGEGTTSFLATTMTQSRENILHAMKAVKAYREEAPEDGARLMGINMEGPFFSEKKKGAQNASYLRLPDYAAFERLYNASEGLLRIADIAAELPGAVEFTEKASKLCTVSIAHTDCTYEEASAVFDAGASHLTHLYNAMPGIHHRKPGPIGAGSERENVVAELISDGYHIHPSAVRMAFRLFPDRICLISDALRCCGMPDGQYTLGGQDVFLKGGVAKLADGTIAGSAANLYECMQRAVSFGIPAEQAILSATIIPAREIGQDAEIGSIAVGKLADFVVCGAALNRSAVYLGGQAL